MSIDLVFKERYERVEKETKDKAGHKISTWSKHIGNWIDKHTELMRSYLKLPLTTKKFHIPSEDITQLFLRRGVELFKNLFWILQCVLYGAYHQAIRELRYSLEMMIQSYYLDTKHPQASLECKMEILLELEDLKQFLTQKTLIKKTKLDNRFKNGLIGLYSELSGYVHPSFIEMQSQYPHVSFNEELLDVCVNFSNRVMDAINKIAEKWKENM